MKTFPLPIRVEVIVSRVRDDDRQYLLVKRVPEDGGFWQPITGTLESNDTILDCIYREVGEEVGIEKDRVLSVMDAFFEFTWVKAGTTITEYVFGMEVPADVEVTLSDEHDAFQWCTYDEALALLEKENNKNALMALHATRA